MNWWSIFLTGLTSGGLSCLAMQGGLLASVMTNGKSGEKQAMSSKQKAMNKVKKIFKKQQTAREIFLQFDALDWLPVTLFLVGKLVSHTLLGFLLGVLGSRLELSLPMRLLFQAVAAFYMFATAANLIELHPIFRYVVVQPPKFFTRLVRNSTKSKALFTPLILGFLTILVPCGITQSMEVLAISSGNPLIGAGILFFFVLGTVPLFSVIGVGVGKLSESWNKIFSKVAAISLVWLGLVGINGILVVMDSPFSVGKIASAIFDPAGIEQVNTNGVTTTANGTQQVKISVVNNGYSPNRIKVKAGIPVDLTLETKDVYSCASYFVMPAFNLKASLGPNDKKVLSFTPEKKGKYTFSCSMGMYTGVMEVI